MSGTRVASALLLHVNLILAVIGGGVAVTCARLKWDPTLYVVVRELLPREWRSLCGLLALAAAALVTLPHLALLALAVRSMMLRRVILASYMLGTMALVAGEASAAWWLVGEARAFLHSPAAREAMQLREHLRPLLQYVARWHPVHHLHALMQEVEDDAPWNGYVACATFLLLLLMQAVSLALAALLIARARSHVPHTPHSPHSPHAPLLKPHHTIQDSDWLNNNVEELEKAPVKAAYRDGRLVLL